MSEFLEPETTKLIADLWRRNRPLIFDRLALLDYAAAAAEVGSLGVTQQLEAESTAHKLSGCLGMFGFPEGTIIAREIESECQLKQPNASRLKELAVALRSALFPDSAAS